MDSENLNPIQPRQFVLDESVIFHLHEIRKWGNFLSIVGFIIIGLMAIFGLFIGTISSNYLNGMFAGGLFTILFLLMVLLYFFPTYYLYKFSSDLGVALKTNDQEKMNSSFTNLKSLFRFFGIATIIVLSLYALLFLIAILTSTLMR